MQERMMNCYRVMEEMVMTEWDACMLDGEGSCTTKTPVCVLDHHFGNSISEKSNTTANTAEVAVEQRMAHESKWQQRSRIRHSQSVAKARSTKYGLSFTSQTNHNKWAVWFEAEENRWLTLLSVIQSLCPSVLSFTFPFNNYYYLYKKITTIIKNFKKKK